AGQHRGDHAGSRQARCSGGRPDQAVRIPRALHRGVPAQRGKTRRLPARGGGPLPSSRTWRPDPAGYPSRPVPVRPEGLRDRPEPGLPPAAHALRSRPAGGPAGTCQFLRRRDDGRGTPDLLTSTSASRLPCLISLPLRRMPMSWGDGWITQYVLYQVNTWRVVFANFRSYTAPPARKICSPGTKKPAGEGG